MIIAVSFFWGGCLIVSLNTQGMDLWGFSQERERPDTEEKVYELAYVIAKCCLQMRNIIFLHAN